MSHSYLTRDVQLSLYLCQRPVALTRMQHICAQARYDHAPAALLLPVDGKRIEVVALKIHHRIQLIHQPLA